MRYLVLVNQASGPGGDAGLSDRMKQALSSARLNAEVRTVNPKSLTDEAKQAVRSGIDCIIAAGGDGTVNAVAAGLVGSNARLGVLPLGTLNHFARAIGMPNALDEAAAAIVTGVTREIDVGEVNELFFVNNASIGLYPHVVGKREELRRRSGRGKWVAMLLACFTLFRRFPTLRVRIIAGDGREAIRETPFVFVGNNQYRIALLAVDERPSLDRGELGLYFTHRSGRFAMFRLALRALLGRLEQAKDFESTALPECTIEAGRRILPVGIDGEIRHLSPPLHFQSRPRALKVIVPSKL